MKAIAFEVELGVLGPERVVVDDVDMTEQVRGVSLVSVAGEPTRVRLELPPSTDIKPLIAKGIVEVMLDVDAGTAISNWLANIDAQVLAEEALQRLDAGEDLTQKMLDVLKEWASGSQS